MTSETTKVDSQACQGLPDLDSRVKIAKSEWLVTCHLVGATSTWLQDIRHKFNEVLQVKAKPSNQDPPTATSIPSEGYAGATLTFDVRNQCVSISFTNTMPLE